MNEVTGEGMGQELALSSPSLDAYHVPPSHSSYGFPHYCRPPCQLA